MLKKIKLFLIAATTVFTASAQDSTNSSKSTAFTISADIYYRYDFANQLANNKTSFTNSNNSFELGMASLRVDHSFGKVSATADIGFGKRSKEFSYNDNGILQAIKQAYITYAPSSKIKFTIGKWATHIGYEVLDAYLNRNYSMSYGFSYGPFSHTGIKTDISLGGKTGLMLGVANPCDYTTTTTQRKVFIGQFSTGLANDKLKGFLNYQGGDDKSQFDLVLNGVVSDKFGINYDGTIANIAGKTWSSNALYLNFDPSSTFGLCLRGEYFNDKKNALGFNTSILQATLSGNIHIANFTLIPELRLDNAKDKIFTTNANAATANASSFLLAAIYKF